MKLNSEDMIGIEQVALTTTGLQMEPRTATKNQNRNTHGPGAESLCITSRIAGHNPTLAPVKF